MSKAANQAPDLRMGCKFAPKPAPARKPEVLPEVLSEAPPESLACVYECVCFMLSLAFVYG